MKFFLISDNTDTLTGMRLAGIEGVIAHDENEVAEALHNAAENKDIGIVMITEKLSGMCSELVKKVRQENTRPIIVDIPDRHGSGRSADSITKYVRDAIGVKI